MDEKIIQAKSLLYDLQITSALHYKVQQGYIEYWDERIGDEMERLKKKMETIKEDILLLISN